MNLRQSHSLSVATHSRARAQGYVEYGLLVGVVVITFLVGLNALMGGATTYLANAEPTPNATVLAGLPNHAVAMAIGCAPAPPPAFVYTGAAFNCTITVTDITTIETGRTPQGSIAFGSAASGTFNPSLCILSGSGVTSSCTFQYTATNFGQQDIIATYHPTSAHVPRAFQMTQVIDAKDRTQTVFTCVNPSVPVGEPAQCSAQVIDLYPARAGPLPGLDVTLTTAATASFSPVGQLSPRGNPPYGCTTDASLACGTLFRSGATPADLGQYTIAGAFAGDPDYDASSTAQAPPVTVSVGGPTTHPVTVDVQCNAGSPQNPLQINAGASTICTATVTDVNALDSRGNPTNVAPTGSIAWSASQDSGGAGTLSSNNCALVQITDTFAQCQVSYTPTLLGFPAAPAYTGKHTLNVTYSTDWIHPNVGNDLQGSTILYVKDQHSVKVNVSCTAGTDRLAPLLIQGASADVTQCSVTVTDLNPAGSAVTPTGSVSWSLSANGGVGAFSPGGACQLQAVNASTAWCQPAVSYQPSVRGTPDLPDQESTHTLSATYSGDWLHPLINNDLLGSANVFVGNVQAVTVVPSCAPQTSRPAPLHAVGPPATSTLCTVVVTDTSASPATPTGTMTWTVASLGAGGTGTFSGGGTCQLQVVSNARAQCQVTYQPTARGAPDGGGPDTDNTHEITASYPGDSLHQPANQTGTTPVYVNN